jgi:hypothetical protein
MIKHVSETGWQGSRLLRVAGILQETRVLHREFERGEGAAFLVREGLGVAEERVLWSAHFSGASASFL